MRLSDARLASMTAGREIRNGVEKQLAQRRIELEKAQIEEARTETELLSAARESNAGQDVRELLQDARRSRAAGIEDKGERLVERVSRADFRDGQKLGARYQKARTTIAALRKQIAGIERDANKAHADASDRLDRAFKSRLDELNEFADRAYSREQERVDAAARDEAAHPQRLADIMDEGRRDLEMSVRRFIADETNYGVVETDARSRRTTTLGLRPGTFAGEAIRFVMQFKGFPIAFTQRVVGRAVFGHRAGATLGERGAHIGSLIAGLTVAGYVSMTMKDIVKGYWPPRDPTKPKTMLAALAQGGAFGIYGDFLFGQTNRFGNSVLESAVGPTISTASDAVKVLLETRDALAGKVAGDETKMPAAEALNLITGNTPYANLFYVKPALDFLFLNSLREAASPDYMRRQERNRQRDYGQGTVPFLGDRRALN